MLLKNEHLLSHSFCVSGTWVHLNRVPQPQGLSRGHSHVWNCDHIWRLTGGRSASELTRGYWQDSTPHRSSSWWYHFLTDYWPKTALSSLLCKIIPRAAHSMTEEGDNSEAESKNRWKKGSTQKFTSLRGYIIF